jgi:hypothetical protein
MGNRGPDFGVHRKLRRAEANNEGHVLGPITQEHANYTREKHEFTKVDVTAKTPDIHSKELAEIEGNAIEFQGYLHKGSGTTEANNAGNRLPIPTTGGKHTFPSTCPLNWNELGGHAAGAQDGCVDRAGALQTTSILLLSFSDF